MKLLNLNGKKTTLTLNTLAEYMDDEIREDLHSKIGRSYPKQSDQVFLTAYSKKHFKKYGKKFDVN